MPSITDHFPTLRQLALVILAMTSSACVGCGTTRWTDSKRTATEQLLMSDAIERAVSNIDITPLSGRKVFLDTTHLADLDDKEYLIGSLRQHMLASGCLLMSDHDSADLVVELRAGALGTDRSSLILGIPATDISAGSRSANVPEMAIAKRTDQRAVAKVAVFAYERTTGRPFWQSGIENVASNARDNWIFGAGPFVEGDIEEGRHLAGQPVRTSAKSAKPDTPAATLAASQLIQLDPPQAAAVDLRRPHLFAAAAPAAATDPSQPTALPISRYAELPPVSPLTTSAPEPKR